MIDQKYVLGVSCFFHDSSAAIVGSKSGLVAACEEERFTRVKHDASFPKNAIAYCINEAGIDPRSLSRVVFFERPWTKLSRIAHTALKHRRSSDIEVSAILDSWRREKLWVKEYLVDCLGVRADLIDFCSHHLSHAWAAFAPSGFSTAACVTIDGVGEWETGTIGEFRDGRYRKLLAQSFPNSIGLLYSAFTEFLGFEVNEGEFKVMGMAAYGDPKYVDRFDKFLHLTESGFPEVDMSYFCYDRSKVTNLTVKFLELFGPPRPKDTSFLVSDVSPNTFINEKIGAVIPSQKYYADVAASLQAVVEKLILGIVEFAHRKTSLRSLVYAGGVAYNSVANGRIIRESSFESVFIQPAAGDNGSSIGAAFKGLHDLRLLPPRERRVQPLYPGPRFKSAEFDKAIEELQVENHTFFESEASMVDRVVDELTAGNVGAIFRGPAEFGPRALGARSIIADPRHSSMKARVNHAVKFRELFRPFAPVVISERAAEFFELENRDLSKVSPFRYMQAVTRVRKEYVESLQAVSHVDGTARVQVLNQPDNPFLYKILEGFACRTGVPILINTSFNRKAEPIVNTPREALLAFFWTDLDFLILDKHLILKKK